MIDILHSSVTAIARSIRTREVSSREVVDACLRRIGQVNPVLNAVVQMDSETALVQAELADREVEAGHLRGPLHGVPMTIKDNLDTAGMVSTGGTQGRRDFIPQKDATVVKRLRSAGAILVGKTNTPELTLAYETDNLIYGRTNNPYDIARTSGGSSGGAAAIVAAGAIPFDIGSDTGGSIRLPAHFCGVAGIRPTSGRTPRTGHILPPGGPSDALTQLGPIAKYVEDLATILPIICGVDWSDPAVVPMDLLDPSKVDITGLRVAYHVDNGLVTPTPEIKATVEEAVDALAVAGAKISDDCPTGMQQAPDLYFGLLQGDGAAAVTRLLEGYGTEHISPWLQGPIAQAQENPMSGAEFGELQSNLDQFRSKMLSFLETYDIIICPVNAYPAMLHGTSEEHLLSFSYTFTYNLTGWPAAVVRVGTTADGLPLGIQVIARPWREDYALGVATFLEKRFGGWLPPSIQSGVVEQHQSDS